jgi:hypothetical protein
VIGVGIAMNVVESFEFAHYLADFGGPASRVVGPVDSHDALLYLRFCKGTLPSGLSCREHHNLLR